jgi:hypothetical protein
MPKYERLLPPPARWSKEDDALVQKLFITGGYQACFAAFPNRSKIGVQKRIRKAKLTKRKFWTEKDDCYLSGSWGFISTPMIAKKLGRTLMAIQQRVNRLKLGTALKSEEGKEPELYEAAAKRTGYHKPTLERILKFSNVSIHRVQSRSPHYNGDLGRFYVYKEDVDSAITRWLSTEMVKPAARRHRVSSPLLMECLKRSGELDEKTMRMWPQWRVPTELIDRVIEEWKSKETLESASHRIGVMAATLKGWLEMYGVPIATGKNFLNPSDVDMAVNAHLARTAGRCRKFTIKDTFIGAST